MSHPSENPFEQPYVGPSNLDPAADSSSQHSRQTPHNHPDHDTPPSLNLNESTTETEPKRRPAALTIPATPPYEGPSPPRDSSGDHSPELTRNGDASLGRKKVKWPESLANHVSIQMASPTSPRTLQDQGAQDALTRALAQHEKQGFAPLEPKFIGISASEGPSRATSSDGDPEERLEELRENMDVFVDPGETDGLPTVEGAKSLETKTNKAAWNLVRGYTNSSVGFRHRKNAGFKSGLGANAEDEKPNATKTELSEKGETKNSADAAPKRKPSIFRNVFSNQNDDPVANDKSVAPSAASTNNAGGGILSALIALQQQQQNGGASGATSGATTPTSAVPSRASSIMSISDDEDEEEERIRWILKQREKRAQKTFVQGASAAISNASKQAAGVATGAVVGVGRTTGLTGIRQNKSSSELHSMGNTPPKTSLANFIASRTNAAPASGLMTPGGTEYVRKSGFADMVSGIKNFGGKAERPDAAKSGAGVFGGLVMATNHIAAPGTPAATTVAPDTERPGYHLSRYSAPAVPVVSPSSHSASHPGSPTEAGSPTSHRGGEALSPAGSTVGGDESPPASPPLSPRLQPTHRTKSKPTFSLNFKDMNSEKSIGHTKLGWHSRMGSPKNSPRHEMNEFLNGGKETEEERERREWEKEKRRRKKAKEKKRQQEIFITQHVAAILERQQFIMKMARSFMMFGAPSHRLEAQMQATARVLEINCQVIYIPGVMLISFGDAATHTSEIKFLKQANGLDLGKLHHAYMVYFNVIYDKISVTDACSQLDALMVAPPKYRLWQNLIIGGLASAFIQPSAFYGSFIDCLAAIPLGSLLVLVQVIVSRNDLYSSLFEIVIACINAFLAAALASSGQFCFAAVASGSVVLILPGYIVLCGALELANRSIISGSVRLVYSILYSLFLGFGLAMGSEVYQRISGREIAGATDYTCSALRLNAPWYRATIPAWWFFLTIPCFCTMLALRNGQPVYRKETPLMVLIGCAGFSANYFSGRAFPFRSDITSAIGSFTVGFLGNLYGKFTTNSAFPLMVVGVLLQLPSGLSNGGLLQFAADSSSNDTYRSENSYSAGFSTAESLVEVAIGLTVGLFVATSLLNLLPGGRKRGKALASF